MNGILNYSFTFTIDLNPIIFRELDQCTPDPIRMSTNIQLAGDVQSRLLLGRRFPSIRVVIGGDMW